MAKWSTCCTAHQSECVSANLHLLSLAPTTSYPILIFNFCRFTIFLTLHLLQIPPDKHFYHNGSANYYQQLSLFPPFLYIPFPKRLISRWQKSHRNDTEPFSSVRYMMANVLWLRVSSSVPARSLHSEVTDLSLLIVMTLQVRPRALCILPLRGMKYIKYNAWQILLHDLLFFNSKVKTYF